MTGFFDSLKRPHAMHGGAFLYQVMAQKFLMISTISWPMRYWASLVAAPMWGVQDTMG